MSTQETTTTEQAGQLGTIVSWRVPSSVSLSALRDALKLAGLDSELALDMLPRNALSRALREMREGRVIRRLRIEGDTVKFQFTAEHFGDTEITYSKEAELTLDLSTGVVACDVEEIQEDARTLLSEHLNKRLTSDLTRLLQRIYDSHRADLIPIREQGGAYFVPDMHRAIVDSTRTLLKSIGGGLRSFDVRLGSADTSASVAESMAEYLSQLMDELAEKCSEVNSKSRKDVRERREAEIAELRQKLECYQGLLGGFAENIGSRITALDSQLMQALLRDPEPEPDEAAAESPELPPADAFQDAETEPSAEPASA